MKIIDGFWPKKIFDDLEKEKNCKNAKIFREKMNKFCKVVSQVPSFVGNPGLYLVENGSM